MLRLTNLGGFNKQWRPASTGFTLAGTGTNNADAGDQSWSDPGNITADDGSYSQAGFKGSGTSEYLHATNFSLGLDANIVLLGLTARLDRYSNGEDVFDHTIQLIVSGTRSGDNMADVSTDWDGADFSNVDYGGLGVFWGLPLAPAALNASTSGLAIRVTYVATVAGARVDAVWLNVDYLQ